eukprot:scaffold7516_cov43-Attheya_sp.AAC.2
MDSSAIRTHQYIRHRRHPLQPDCIHDIMCCCPPIAYNLVQVYCLYDCPTAKQTWRRRATSFLRSSWSHKSLLSLAYLRCLCKAVMAVASSRLYSSPTCALCARVGVPAADSL